MRVEMHEYNDTYLTRQHLHTSGEQQTFIHSMTQNIHIYIVSPSLEYLDDITLRGQSTTHVLHRAIT